MTTTRAFALAVALAFHALFPLKAFAIPPLVWAFGAAVSLHGSALLFKFDDVKQPASAPDPQTGATSGGGVSFKLNGEPTIKPEGWKDPVTPPDSGQLTTNHAANVDKCKFTISWNYNRVYLAVEEHSPPQAAYVLCKATDGLSVNMQRQVTACTPGYSLSGIGCVLVDPSLVRKPDGTPCEFVYKAGKFIPDPKNPACDGKATNTISRSGCDLTTSFEKMSMSCPSTNSTLEMTPTQLSGTSEAGSFSVPAAVDENGVYTVSVTANLGIPPPSDKITVDFYGSVNGGAWGCIDGHCKDTTNTGSTGGSTGGTTGGSTGGSTGGDGSGTGGTTGDGSGSGTGDGSTGTGDASGGSTSIDDSGFAGADGKLGEALGKSQGDANTAEDGLMNKVTEQFNQLDSIGFSWVPIPRNFAACRPIPVTAFGSTFEWNFCPYVTPLAEAMGYLFYLFTGLYLFRLFADSSKE